MNSTRALEILTALAAAFSAPVAYVPKLHNDPVQELPGGYPVAELAQACRIGAAAVSDALDAEALLDHLNRGA